MDGGSPSLQGDGLYVNLRFLNSDRKRLQRTIRSITVEWHC